MLRKKPKWIFIICGVFLIMQYLICSNVYLMGGDDYMYGSFGHNGIFASVFSYYFTGNGRWLINIIDSFQLIFDRYLYLIITPWLLLLLSFAIYRFICILFNKDNVYIFVASIGLISMIDIQMTRETTYWITGAMNYLVPALFLMAGMSATLQLRKKDLPGKEATLCGVLCLLSCLTVEQYGLMSIGWMILIWGHDLILSKKINKRNTLILLISLITLSTIILAPGNYVRIDDAAEKGIPLITKFIDLIYYDYYSKASSTFLFVLAVLCLIRFFRSKKKPFLILSALNALIILVCFVYNYINAPFIIVILSIMLSLITLTPTLISVFKQVGLISLLSLVVISFGSQMMLLVSQLWGFRTSMCLVLVYIVLILALLRDTINADRPSNIYIYIYMYRLCCDKPVSWNGRNNGKFILYSL